MDKEKVLKKSLNSVSMRWDLEVDQRRPFFQDRHVQYKTEKVTV